MDRPKTLPPTLRDRKRYIVFQAFSESKISYEDLSTAVWHSCLNFLGEHGVGDANMNLIKDTFDPDKQTCVLRCSHTSVDGVRTALALIRRIGDSRVVIKVNGISGTIRGAKTKFF
ncbi:MAG TPA: Rpp14/Pop5 family protein [archaeon]|nr:Rpp14/Pop5 family protein [archaeon]